MAGKRTHISAKYVGRSKAMAAASIAVENEAVRRQDEDFKHFFTRHKGGGYHLKLPYYTLMMRCARLGLNLREIAQFKGMPSENVLRWCFDKIPAIKQQFERSQLLRADALFDEILEIADDGRNDWMEVRRKDGAAPDYAFNHEHVQRSKVRIDARKYMIGVLNEGKYAERTAKDREAVGKLDVKVEIRTIYEDRKDSLAGKVLEGEVVKTVEDIIAGVAGKRPAMDHLLALEIIGESNADETDENADD